MVPFRALNPRVFDTILTVQFSQYYTSSVISLHYLPFSVIPSIVSLPAPVTYLDSSRLDLASGTTSPTLTCEVWPPNANISLLIAHPIGDAFSPSGSRSQLSLEAIPRGQSSVPFRISQRLVPGNATMGMMDAMTASVPAFSNAAANLEVLGDDQSSIWSRVDSVDVHCRADTKFGAVLSAPFRVALSSKYCVIFTAQ